MRHSHNLPDGHLGGKMNNAQVLKVSQEQKKSDRPAYVPPRLQVMSERDILKVFQVTQAMQTWWTTGC
jgi:hypothetical protein